MSSMQSVVCANDTTSFRRTHLEENRDHTREDGVNETAGQAYVDGWWQASGTLDL